MTKTLKTLSATLLLLMFVSMSAMPLVASAAVKIPSGLIPCGNAPSGSSVDTIKGQECTFDDLLKLGLNIVKYLVWLSIPLAAISFAWAGFLYLSSAGNQSKVESAKQIFIKTLIGFLFVISAWLIVWVIVSLLLPDLSLLKPN
jgi:hypothetical protein